MNQPQPGEIIEGAQAMRQYLKALVGEQAESIDRELATLLEQAQQPNQQAEVEKQLLFFLSHHEATRQWLFDYVAEKQQLAEGQYFKSFSPPPGPNTPVPATMYCCPQGDYKWPQFFVGAPIPDCPNHHVPLTLC